MLFGDSINTIIISVVSLLVAYYFYLREYKWKRFPPGPMGIPLLGYAPFLGDKASEKMMKIADKFGPIFSLKMGDQTWVVLNTYDILHEALVKHGEVFSGRPQVHIYKTFTKGLGIGFVDYGPFWKKQRKFGMNTLKRFGFENVYMEDFISEEVQYLIDEVESYNGKSLNCHSLISNAVANIVCRMTMSKRFPYEDKDFNEMLRLMNESFSAALDGKLYRIMVLAPFTRFLPLFWSCYNRLAKSRKVLLDTLQTVVDEHKQTYDENNIRDFIDEFIKEMKTQNDENSNFTDEQLVHYVSDLFVAGTETTSSTLRWCMLCLATYPEIQEKLFHEIQSVIGIKRAPSLKDKDLMPYTCAFIHEITRHRIVLNIFVPHKTTASVMFKGFYIPKNTPIIAHPWSVHFDPQYFKNPREFLPERFIGEDEKFVPSPQVIPFSLGPRYCLGKRLAKAELFIFITGIVQWFKILPDPENPLPSFHEGVEGGVHAPHDFNVIFSRR
ncbi:cytochrome P450 2U1-like [Styela clava]